MRVPLAVTPMDDQLLIYRNGKTEMVNIPFQPFAMLQGDKFPDIVVDDTMLLTKVPENEVRQYKKLEFFSVRDLMNFKDANASKSQYFHINGITEQLYISHPDFLLQYPHTNDITVMFFDIEVASKGDGLFPKAITNEILCIGYSIWKYKIDGTIIKTKMKIINSFNRETMNDYNIIDEFFNDVQTEDPDIIAGYNSTSFDFPYLIQRAGLKGIDPTRLGRTNNPPRIVNNHIIIPGRIHFDIYSSNSGVIKDQTLFGIKNRTLKELARFYKAKNDEGLEIQDVEVKEHIENLLNLFDTNPQLLYDYLTDDIYRTECVGHVYMRNCITLAERMHVPLQSIILMYSSFIPKVMVARHYEKLDLINTETNFSKYNFQNGTVAKTGVKYEGALVGLYKDGLFDTTYKIDFSSMYPSSIQTFNLGPDTTSLVRAIRGPDKSYKGDLDYTGKFTVHQDNKYNWYRIPCSFDNKTRYYDLIVKVRNDKEGFLKQEIAKLREERVKIKIELTEAKKNNEEDKIIALNSQQYAIKVILNCFHPDTEILTENGLKLLKDIKAGENVWSINPITGKTELKLVEKTYSYDIVDQDFYNISHQRFSQGVTEGHKMLGVSKNNMFFEESKDFVTRNRVEIPTGYGDLNIPYDYIYLLDFISNTEDYELIIKHTEDLRKIKSKFKDVTFVKTSTLKNGSIITSAWGENIKNICRAGYVVLARAKRSKLCSAVPIRVNNTDFSNFVGWYLSEGSLYISKPKKYISTKRGITKKITISQDDINKSFKGEILQTLKNLLKHGLKSKVYRYTKGFSFSSDLYADIINTHLGTHFNKFISQRIMKKLDIEKIQCAMYKGDGTKHQRRYTISCKSKDLFNSYLELLIRLGRTFSYSIDSGCYRIVDKTNNVVLKKSNTIKTKYTGKVYSLTVKDNHTVYAGLNGKMGWIGQSIYGFLGLKSSKYGEMISAAMVTGICRWTSGKVIRRFKNELIEIDTDGMILTVKPDEKEVNKWLAQIIKERFAITDNYMEMEIEEFGRSFFYAMKNYVVQDGEDLAIHGSSLKASKFSHVEDRARDLAIQHIFNNKPKEEVIREAYNFDNCALDDFVRRVNLRKEIIEYDDQTCYQVFLAKQVELKTKQKLTSGETISYVVTKDKLPYKDLQLFYKDGANYSYIGFINNKEEIDLTYYLTLIDRKLAMFGIEKVEQLTLDLGSVNEKRYAKKLSIIPTDDI